MNPDSITFNDATGASTSLNDYRGHVVLIVNTASKCGYTPQFEGLEALYQAYKDEGLVVLGFPCNQFGDQDPGTTDDSVQFCHMNYGVSFPMMAKIDVNGKEEAPFYHWLKSQKPGVLGKRIKWNFTKFLIDRNGNVVERYGSSTEPADIEPAIKELLR